VVKFLFSLFVFIPQLHAATVKEFPKEVKVDGQTLLLNGTGLRTATIFNVKVYSAGLYLKQKASTTEAVLSAKGPKRLEMEFLRDVDANDVREAWDRSFAANCVLACESGKDPLDAIKKMMPDLKKGDRMVVTFNGPSVELTVNNSKKGEIKAKDFPSELLSTWIGKKPPNEDLKKGLLGLK
jgi:hypothetical protein